MKIIKINYLVMLLLPLLMFGQGITVSTDSGLDVVIGGEVELEFVDVQGEGGFINSDLTYQKVKNRSPHMRIDKAVLSTRINYTENMYYHIEFRFDDNQGQVDKHYLALNLPALNTKIEAGKNRPMVGTKRFTEGYPLIGTAYWKGREMHITSMSKYALSDAMSLTGGLSFAMKRSFGTDDVAEDKSFKMMVYDDYETRNGQTFEYGITLGLEAFGLKAEGWYYTGELIDDFDWKSSLGFLPGYDDVVEAFDGERDDLTHWWGGGRLSADVSSLHFRGEYITSMDGLLPRNGYYGEGSYRIKLNEDAYIAPTVRYGELNVERHSPALGDPSTWDRNLTTLALVAKINSYFSIKMEYYLLDEVTGGSVTYDEELGEDIDNSMVKDNQFLLQTTFEF